MQRIWLGFLLIFLEMATVAPAQLRLSPGIQVGTPLTDTLASSSISFSSGISSSFDSFHSVTKRLLIGPSLRLELPRGLGLEFDALYQRINYDEASGSFSPGSYSNQSFQQTTANRWQFPLLVQYSHRLAKVRPFVEVGPSISAITGGSRTAATSTVNVPSPASTSTSTAKLPALTSAGITAGGGIGIPFLGHSLRAEVRFSHWFGNAGGYSGLVSSPGYVSGAILAYPNIYGPLSAGFQSQPNEASFLLGISF